MDFEKIMAQLRPPLKQRLVVAAAEDDMVLKAVAAAQQRELVDPILCGDPVAIEKLARQWAVDISHMEVVPAASRAEAARTAVSLVRRGHGEILMKGILPTAEFLRAVLDKENGLRGPGILSHVGVLHSPMLDRTLLLTDAAMVPYPDLKTKAELIRNAVHVARGLGIHTPKVAALAAVEVVNPDMQATIDAAALTIMNRRGQIKDCIVDGPLALDLAVSAEAVQHKGIRSEVAGRADIFLFHNIEAANSTLKGFVFGGGCLFGGLLVGARAPVVVASRSDSDHAKLYSIACAAALTETTSAIREIHVEPVDASPRRQEGVQSAVN